MEKITKPRGTMDILPPDIYQWSYIESTARRIAGEFGFSEIRTPTFEDLGLFARGVGEGTDVVQKEMYTFSDREGRAFALRPEGTASVARALIENGKCSDTMPQKLFYLINCFRYEKPQAGRSREFFQFGSELFGSADPAADFTIISLAAHFLSELGISNVRLHVNSIGCPECRPLYRQALTEYLEKNESRLCDTCKTRLKTNPLRVLDCKNDECKRLADDAPKTIDHLCGGCKAHMDTLISFFDECSLDYVIDPHIVRGLDYYTRTVFEFIAGNIGAQSTVCGGGRYDGLVSELGGPSLPACGFAMGITRLILAMNASGVAIPEREGAMLYIASMGDQAKLRAVGIANLLISSGIRAECDIVGRSLKAQMKYADKIGAQYVLIIGEAELESGKAQLKDMKNSTQREIRLDRIACELSVQ